jgi:hypothetical protein
MSRLNLVVCDVCKKRCQVGEQWTMILVPSTNARCSKDQLSYDLCPECASLPISATKVKDWFSSLFGKK